MRTLALAGSAIIGAVVGAVLFNAAPAYADLPVIDPASIAEEIKQFAQETGILDVLNAMSAVQNTISSTMKDINTAIGNLPVPSNVSVLQSLQIESERRFSDINWNAALQTMPPASVQREIATELALNDYLLFQIYKFGLERGVINAANLAVNTEHDYLPTAPLPTPSVASSSSP